MLTKEAIRAKAEELGFDDIGFTSAAPLTHQKEMIRARREQWEWTRQVHLDLFSGYDPESILSNAKSIIVLVDHYHRETYPKRLLRHFGRVYLDDDRVTKNAFVGRSERFRDFLREHGIASETPFNLSHRESAVRAGLGTIGRNSFFYSNKVGLECSWVIPWAIVVDHAIEPDAPSKVGVNCPDKCKQACVAACPTGAVNGDGTVNPLKCVSFLTYETSEVITPHELREPMGLYIYGCDRCQMVCPRNRPWNKEVKTRPINPRVAQKADDFEITRLLHMDKDYFTSRIWVHMFYISPDSLWKWKMHAARAMGNSGEERYVPHLIQAFGENDDERVRGMVVWALGKIGTGEAMAAIDRFARHAPDHQEIVRNEIDLVLKARTVAA